MAPCRSYFPGCLLPTTVDRRFTLAPIRRMYHRTTTPRLAISSPKRVIPKPSRSAPVAHASRTLNAASTRTTTCTCREDHPLASTTRRSTRCSENVDQPRMHSRVSQVRSVRCRAGSRLEDRSRWKVTSVRDSGSRAPSPTLSIVIPTALEADVLAGCLSSLAAQMRRADRFEAVVVQYGQEDGSRAAVAQELDAHPDLKVQYLHHPGLTRSAAKNVGLKASSGDSRCTCAAVTDSLTATSRGSSPAPPQQHHIVVPIVVEMEGDGPADVQSERGSNAARQGGKRAGGGMLLLGSMVAGEGFVYPRPLIESIGLTTTSC